MDEDRLTPQLGRLIDAAKAEAGAAGARAEGWAVLTEAGGVHTGRRLADVLAAVWSAGAEPEAAAFAIAGERGDTLLPRGDWRRGAENADPHLPVVVKYLGRWVVVTLEEIPGG